MADDPDQLLKAQDVARIIRFSARTIRRWTAEGKLDDCLIRTPGGKYRYREDAIRARFLTPKSSAPGTPLTIATPGADPDQEG